MPISDLDPGFTTWCSSETIPIVYASFCLSFHRSQSKLNCCLLQTKCDGITIDHFSFHLKNLEALDNHWCKNLEKNMKIDHCTAIISFGSIVSLSVCLSWPYTTLAIGLVSNEIVLCDCFSCKMYYSITVTKVNLVFFGISFIPSLPKTKTSTNVHSHTTSNGLSVLLLDSVSWFVPEICYLEIGQNFMSAKMGKTADHPHWWRCKLSYLLNGLSHNAAQKLTRLIVMKT